MRELETVKRALSESKTTLLRQEREAAERLTKLQREAASLQELVGSLVMCVELLTKTQCSLRVPAAVPQPLPTHTPDAQKELKELKEALATARRLATLRGRTVAKQEAMLAALRKEVRSQQSRETKAQAAVQAEIARVRKELFAYIEERTKLPRE